IRATDGAGAFVLGGNGLYGTFRATIAVDVPGVSFGSQLDVEIDTTAIVQTPADIPNGLRIVGSSTLEILGQQLGGDFVITRTAGVVTVAVTNLTVRIKAGDTTLVDIQGLSGALRVDASGIAARLESAGSPAFALLGIRIEEDSDPATTTGFMLELNTGASDADHDANPLTDPIAAGPLFRVSTSGLQLCFTTGGSCAGAPTLRGDFFFDQTTRNGFGSSVPIQSLPADTSASRALAVGDVDNDGDLDLVVGNNGPNSLYLNNGSGVFTPAAAALFGPGTGNTAAVALADVNSDTFLDLVVADADGTTKVYLNRGRGALVTGGGPSPLITWSLPARFGLDPDGDGLIDYFTSTGAISPSTWPVDLDGCGSVAGASPIAGYSWTFAGNAAGTTCSVTYPAQSLGTFTVTLTVTDQDGASNTATMDILVRDLLIVSLGDSVASGEGNPDLPWTLNPFSKETWQDEQCHRTALAGTARAAIQMEQADPHTSVTFIHLACSGGRIEQIPADVVESDTRTTSGQTDAISGPGITGEVALDVTAATGTLSVFVETSTDGTTWTTLHTFGPLTAAGQHQADLDLDVPLYRIRWAISGASPSFTFKVTAPDGSGGVLEPYRGIEPPANPADPPLKPQLERLLELIGTRTVDAVLLSVGANDLKFSAVIQNCILHLTCEDDNPQLAPLLAALPGKYLRLANALTAAGIPAGKVFITEYFNPTQDGAGVFRDIVGIPGLPGLITGAELQWANTAVVEALNAAVHAAATAHGWNLVGGIASEFLAHGYAADDHWVVRLLESLGTQKDINGSFHPNGKGQVVYARQIFTSLAGALSISGGDPDWAGFSLTAAETLTTAGATSVAAGDLDGDGLPDLVVGATGAATSYFLNDGLTAGVWDGFGSATTIGTSTTRAVAVGDVNGDRLLDLVVGNQGSATMLYLNDGFEAGGDWKGFAAGTTVTTAATTSIAIGDLDGDRFPDLVVGNTGSASQLFLNKGLVAGVW
ncbi:MAG: FG-GAP-like repeat-containing protein, partial [Gaiellaceae bacterium]